MSREPFEWIEIDQDFCSRTYGVAPCTATVATGGQKCFNTRQSCQDPANYVLGDPLTLRFCKSMAFIPKDAYYLPSLRAVSVSPARINPGGVNRSSGALGVRSQITATFQDHAHTDRIVDPYVSERSYIPVNQSTFWAKWRARNPYYLNRPLRYYTGFIVDGAIDPASIIERAYFITSFSGPDANGAVSITAQDALALLQDEKAQAPAASAGKLVSVLSAVGTSFSVEPAGIGNTDYPASGYVCLDDEVIQFTRSADTFTVVNRAQFGTAAASHNAGATIQACVYYNGATPSDILEDLCITYGRIDAQYLDTTQWANEQTDFMPRLYSALIPKPTGVTSLISEMTEQMYFYPWWDERGSKVKIRAVRPAEGDTVYQLNENSHLVEDSVSVSDKTDQLITQVWVYYGMRKATGSLTEPANFEALEIIGDLDAEGDERNRQSRVKTVFCRWITSANGAAAIDLGEKLLARYSTVPREVSFMLGTKDSDIWLGDFVQIATRHNVDLYGSQLPLNIQIFSAQEAIVGTMQRYSGQEFAFEAPVDPTDRLIVISGNLFNVNLRTMHDSLYSPPVGGETIRVIIRSGVTIGGEFFVIGGGKIAPITDRDSVSTSVINAGDTAPFRGVLVYPNDRNLYIAPTTTSLETGSWPSGVSISLTIESGANVIGHGGPSSGNSASFLLDGHYGNHGIGSDGGHAIGATYPITINNLGTIAGGGGGGAMYANNYSVEYVGSTTGLMIVGGGGAGVTSMAAWESAANAYYAVIRQAAAGSATTGGVGAIGRRPTTPGGPFTSPITYPDLTAGAGGNLATDGGKPTGQNAMVGRAGNAVIAGANLITWTNKGDVRGAEAN